VTPLAQDATVVSSTQASLTFINQEPAVVNGTIQVCKQDTTAAFLPGWDFTTDGVTQTTDGTGCTVFDLAPGTYTVTETLKDGWTNVTPLAQDATVVSNTQASLTFINQEPALIDLWCGKQASFWRTEILKFQKSNPIQSRKVCGDFFNADVLSSTGYSSWTNVYNALKDGGISCDWKANIQLLALKLDQQYYDHGLNFRIDTSLMSSDDPCKAVLRNACDGNTQCTVQSIYDDWPGNCRTAQKVGSCLNTYTFGCYGTNSPSNYCSGGA
jgi:hypothetical protein